MEETKKFYMENFGLKLTFESESKAASVVLYARYLKRIGSHLSNIMTTLTNPFEAVGYVSK